MTALAPGSPAPDLTLPWKPGQPPLRLADHQGTRALVVLFFPLAFSPVCTEEICHAVEDWSGWNDVDAPVVGISVDSLFALQRFARECGADFPLLSDFNREAAEAFGVLNDDYFGAKGVAYRAAFVVDAGGVVRYSWMTEDDRVLPDFAAIGRVVDELERGAS